LAVREIPAVWIPAAASCCCCWSCCYLHHPAAAAITLTSWEWKRKRRSRRSSCRKQLQRGRPLLHRHPPFPHPPKPPSQTDGRSEFIYRMWITKLITIFALGISLTFITPYSNFVEQKTMTTLFWNPF
jgi:hypothetical protein